MITEWLVWLGVQIGNFFASLLPDWTAPTWFTGFGDMLNRLFDSASGIGNLIGWAYIIPVFQIAITVYIACLILKAAMKVWSFAPFVGGTG